MVASFCEAFTVGKGGEVALVPETEGTVDSWMPNAPVERVRWGYGEVGYVAAPSV